ncbi:hypothetical protein D9611_007895 [Ephemerocybe angulata]|uniref:G domain-containing protein n=1 Tax=Ephemerocybe angulata TaxID=980116 RepID=A0A8H5CE93_9AGAR|nr:hypothetical protein D9611_007895 [Tulosesus angulatus]
MGEHPIVVLGRFDAGKSTFIEAVCSTANNRPGLPLAEEAPTQGIIEYEVSLPDGRTLAFIDTPGFDGYQPGGEPAKETEEILQMLEEHLAANGSKPVSHVLVFLNANNMNATEFKPRAQRAFERLFPNAQIACITTRWDQIEDDDGPPVTAEEAQSKEEGLYARGRTSGSLLEYLHGGRQNRGGDVLRFRSGLPNAAYSSPQVIVRDLFARPGSDTTLEERLAAMTKERDDLAAKYARLLQEKQVPTAAPAAPGPKEAARTLRTRRQRLLDTIDKFSAHVLEMVAELDREALDVDDECTANRDAIQSASAAIKVAEGKLAEATEDVKAAQEECSRLKQERDSYAELERSLSTQLSGLETSAGGRVSRSVKQRIASQLKQTQTSLKDMEDWMVTAADDYRTSFREVEEAGAEIEKWRRIEQGEERALNEWLSPESERLSKERESFRALQKTLSTKIEAMREGLKDSWEGTLGDNSIFLERLGGYAVDPDMVAHRGGWAPAMESLYESQVTLALTQEMVKFHSSILQRVKAQEDAAQREWKEGVEDIFGPVPKDLPPPPPPLSGHASSVTSAAFSWDGTKIVSGSDDQTVRVWDALTGELQTVLEGHSTYVVSVAFSPDGKDVVSGSYDNTVRVWDVLGGRVKRVLRGHGDLVRSVGFSADGSRIISGSNDRTARIWNASNGEVQRILEGHTATVSSVVFSEDGSRIISGSEDNSVRVWDALTGEVRAVLEGHRNLVRSVALSGDGLRVVSGSDDRTVRVWDALTGKVLRVLEGHNDIVYSVSFSRDGSWICSGSVDKTMRVWDASTGTAQHVLEGHSDTVRAVAFSRDGRRVVSGSHDKTIRPRKCGGRSYFYLLIFVVLFKSILVSYFPSVQLAMVAFELYT